MTYQFAPRAAASSIAPIHNYWLYLLETKNQPKHPNICSLAEFVGLLYRTKIPHGTYKNPARLLRVGGVFEINLAIPTFALVGTIIGPESLTAVFGMGTGVSFPVWSPEEALPAVRRSRAWF